MDAVKGSKNQSLEIKSSLVINHDDSVITASPSEKLKLVSIIDFPYAAIGKQVFSIELTPRNFVTQIARARTFGFKDQIDSLKRSGLIKEQHLVVDKKRCRLYVQYLNM